VYANKEIKETQIWYKNDSTNGTQTLLITLSTWSRGPLTISSLFFCVFFPGRRGVLANTSINSQKKTHQSNAGTKYLTATKKLATTFSLFGMSRRAIFYQKRRRIETIIAEKQGPLFLCTI
jgi:hypothetical protein